MRVDFRVDWGYQYLYSRRHYHPVFVWDGNLTCDKGEIIETYQLTYPALWFGPGQSAKEEKLEAPEWKNFTKRRLAGVRFVAEVEEDTEFTLTTASGTFKFKAADIVNKGYFNYQVGPKYLGCFVNVYNTGYYWYRPEAKEGQAVIEVDDLGLEVHNWARMFIGWLRPEQKVTFKVTVPETTKDYQETLIHLVAMAVPEFTTGEEYPVWGDMDLELYCDGTLLKTFRKFYRYHDIHMQILEDDWVRASVTPGEHEFGIVNKCPDKCLGISRIVVMQSAYNHGQLSIPDWALKGETLVGKVYATKEDTMTVTAGETEYTVACKEGWNEFTFTADVVDKMKFISPTDEATIEVYDIEEEARPVKVGYDMTVVPHDENGFMDWLLDYTQRTRLGNYVVFRPYRHEYDGTQTPRELMKKWGEFCRTHGIYTSASNTFMDGGLVEGAGEWFNDCGEHELSHKVYALNPTEPYASEDMKEAYEGFINYIKKAVDRVHTVSNCAAFGDASGGIRHSFLAGAGMVRAETMVGPTMNLLPQARAAAEGLSTGRWGVHIAIQHAYQPYKETHLGQYFLALFQPWMMGAEVIYEEDSLFNLFKEERQAWDDLLTKGKRDMTRSFFKFVKTHPRKGVNKRNIAFLEGRYAAPFNGFICDVDQDPHYAVWGLFGKNAPEWGHGQPEKCRHVIDVLMPGSSTHPMRQQHDKRRFFFAGTPYGDFDNVPVEVGQDYLNQYKLLLNLGWNTMIPEDYDKIKDYVENGGVLLTGIPQFSTHVKREFLKDMQDLALWNEGDLSELCGIRVKGIGENYCGQWNCAGREFMAEPDLSSAPNDCVCEDGAPMLADIDLCGAEVVAWDTMTGAPMLVKKQVGKGTVYTFTIWAYPGHEQFQKFSAAWTMELSKRALPDVLVEDPSKEIFWTRWEDGDKTILMLLNTDWTVKGNIKYVNIVSGSKKWSMPIKERTAVIVEVENGQMMFNVYSL